VKTPQTKSIWQTTSIRAKDFSPLQEKEIVITEANINYQITKDAQLLWLPSHNVGAKDFSPLQANLNLKIAANVTCRLAVISLPQQDFQAEVTVELANNASINSSLLVIGKANHKITWQWRQRAIGNNVKTNLITRSILLDKSEINIRALPQVDLNCRDCQVALEQVALHLSNNCRSVQSPLLAISNNQVKAKHSYALAQLSNDDYTYLASRNLDKKQADSLLGHGMLQEVLADLPANLKQIGSCAAENFWRGLKTF